MVLVGGNVRRWWRRARDLRSIYSYSECAPLPRKSGTNQSKPIYGTVYIYIYIYIYIFYQWSTFTASETPATSNRHVLYGT